MCRTVELRLLGSLEVLDGGTRVSIGPPKHRLLLAVLASRPGRTVATAELAEALWKGDPPASAAANLRGYVHGLRRTLGADAISGHGRPGYALSVAPEAVDTTRFQLLAGRARAELADGRVAAARELLHEALGLWRGPAFEDLADAPVLQAHAAELEEHRLTALECRIEADLYAGAGADLVAELRRLVEQHPYRERFHAHLMVALQRSGRQADALAAYRAARTTLRRDLGIEPGPELRRLEAMILRGEPCDGDWTLVDETPPSVPNELPVAGRFAGRAAELDRLDAVAAGTAATGTTPVVAVVGPGGVGKTALAVHWAHRAAADFPDGQLFVDLRGFHPAGAVAPDEALARLLRALGVPRDRVPAGADEAAALYRTLVAHRRVLVVLDNASSAAQVRPLLPAGKSCLALVTSRNTLSGLAAREGAEVLTLRSMPVAEGLALLAAVWAPDRVRVEQQAAAELVEACGGLPLALRIAAANLAEQADRSIASYVAELRDGHRLDRLANDGDEHMSVRATFGLSYAALADGPRRLFALVGLLPGPDLTVDAAAALADLPAAETARHLDRLAGAHLLQRPAPGRWAPHDLAREYARERALDDETGDRDAALRRLLRLYRRRADAAARVLFPQLLRLETDEPEPLPDRAGALDWLGAEFDNLVAATVHAAEHGPYEEAWLIADALRGYCFYQVKLTEWWALASASAAAAARAGDVRAMAASAMSRGHCRHAAADYGAALAHFGEALDLSRQCGWPESEATLLGNLAATHGILGDLDRAAEYQLAALAINRRIGWRPGEMLTLGNLGITMMWRGRLAEAESYFRAGLDLCRADGADAAQAAMLAQLVEVITLTARYEEARALVAEGIPLARAAGRMTAEVHLLVRRANLRALTGRPAAAFVDAARALELVEPTGDRLLASAAHTAYGGACARLGRTAEALAHHDAALRMITEIRGRCYTAEALVASAEAARPIRPGLSRKAARQALAAARTGGLRVVEGMAHALLAFLEHTRGCRSAGRRHASHALRVAEQTGWRLPPDRLRVLRRLCQRRDGTLPARAGARACHHSPRARRLARAAPAAAVASPWTAAATRGVTGPNANAADVAK